MVGAVDGADGSAWAGGVDGGFVRLHPQYAPLVAEVAFACRHEFAETAVDVLAHRTRLSFLDAAAAKEALPRVLQVMRDEKGWDDAHVAQERARAEKFLEDAMTPAPGGAPSALGAPQQEAPAVSAR